MKRFLVLSLAVAVAAPMAWSVGTAKADHPVPEPGLDPGLDWPDFYDPEAIRHLNIKIKQQDWDLIRADVTYDIEVPALFWLDAEGEQNAVLVSIRRKSATPIGTKVSFKIDINEYEGEDPRAHGKWHGLKKLSLENGDDRDVVAEAMAWYLHRLGANSSDDAFPGAIPGVDEEVPAIYPAGHLPGLANWATLTAHVVCDVVIGGSCALQTPFEFDGAVTVEPQGVYVNVEQPDKQLLKNRGIWASGETWLYKKDSPNSALEVKEAPELVDCQTDLNGYCMSPALVALQCAPFHSESDVGGKRKLKQKDCDPYLVEQWVDMPILLATGAVNAFTSNPDELLNHGKNFLFVDYAERQTEGALELQSKRLHFPWDLDSAFANDYLNKSTIYGEMGKRRGTEQLQQTHYQRVLLQNYPDGPTWCDTYNRYLTAMAGGGFVGAAISYLDWMEPLLGPHLVADPNSKIVDVEAHFDALRTWLTDRADNVRGQISGSCGK